MPEFDALLDHIYEYGTASEGIIDRANAFARAIIAQALEEAATLMENTGKRIAASDIRALIDRKEPT
ncbi:hypothetical protein CAL14_05365 [Bordetella genomosp. 9]|nr:hypothetical protein CAL14_05365 [Bordetella genomosp. 9]